MYEFHKNSKGEYTEGFLGEPENFNGIVFLLREPNTGGEPAEEFWFKKVLNDSENYHKALESSNTEESDIKRSKGTSTKFINRFTEMLEFSDHKKDDIYNSVFCNIKPENGEKVVGKKYEEELESSKLEEMILYFASLKDEITVFTCFDIYNELLELDNIKNKEEKTGLKYKSKVSRCFEGEICKAKIKVYEIVHPSVSSKITKKE